MNSCLESFSKAITVKPIRRVIPFADAEIFVKAGVRYDSSRTPYIDEIGNALSFDSPTQQVSAVKGQQLGLTELLKLVIAQIMAENPDNIIYGLPSISTAIQFSKSKLQKMIDCSPVLKAIVSDASSRDGTNTNLMKEYPGGHINIVTSNSSAEWRMKDARFVGLDEYDAHNDIIDGEGSGKEIAEGRTAAKGDLAKIALISTPIEMARSKIWKEFLNGSQEYYYVPCPFCMTLQVMKWENFKYEKGDVDSIRLKCVNMACGKLIEEKHKTWMMSKESGARWIAHNPNRQNKLHRSFHLSSFYSPIGFLSWKKICQKWFDCAGNREKRKAFSQLVEAIPYQEPDEEMTPVEELLNRRYKFSHKVPKEVLLLTAFCDMQNNRLEVTTWGWGLNDQAWRIDKEVFYAPEGRRIDHLLVWEQLEIYRKKTFIHESGAEINISAFGVDTGGGSDGEGHYSEQAYNFVRGKFDQLCFATKGSSTPGAPLYARSKNKNKGGVPLYLIGTDTVKRTLYGRFRAKNKLENGYIHLPDFTTDEEIHQLLSEKLALVREKNSKNQFENHKKWKKIRDRNEEWDCFCGAYAVMRIIKPNFVALQELYLIENQENNTNDEEMIENIESLQEKTENVVDSENNIDNGEPQDEEQDESEKAERDYSQRYMQERRGIAKPRQPRRNGWFRNRLR